MIIVMILSVLRVICIRIEGALSCDSENTAKMDAVSQVDLGYCEGRLNGVGCRAEGARG